MGQSEEHQNDEKYKVDKIVNFLKAPAADGDMDRRRKAEHQLYIQELRREDMTLKHYLIEKQWGRAWMLFRTRMFVKKKKRKKKKRLFYYV